MQARAVAQRSAQRHGHGDGMNLQTLRARGFDQSAHIPFTKQYRVHCSCCESMVINGTPTHETGCPNSTHECLGCDANIPANRRYCADCM
jgi:hypothetical protein